jgi:hypothetical protein
MAGPLPRTPVLEASEGLTKLATYPHKILAFVGPDGYPISVAVEATIDPASGVASFAAPAGFAVPADADISLTGSHIRPQPGYGYDERRHVTVWGRAATDGGSRSAPRGRGAGMSRRSPSSSIPSDRCASRGGISTRCRRSVARP